MSEKEMIVFDVLILFIVCVLYSVRKDLENERSRK